MQKMSSTAPEESPGYTGYELGWTFTTVRYCQAIRAANKEKRLVWCSKHLEEKELVGLVGEHPLNDRLFYLKP